MNQLNSVNPISLQGLDNLCTPFHSQESTKFDRALIQSLATLSNLPVMKTAVNYVDFDDTLATRIHQLDMAVFQDNRGEAGNRVIGERFGGNEAFGRRFYGKFPILVHAMKKIINEDVSRILTAGEYDLQETKIRETRLGINKDNILVVKKTSDKPIEILNDFIRRGFIPKTINIYDDRVKYFLRDCPIMAEVLGITINVNQVELCQDNTRSIKDIKRFTFQQSREVVMH